MDYRKVAYEAIINHLAMQNLHEFIQTLALADSIAKPESVLEIGSHYGGSLWAWKQLPTVKKVVGVTLEPGSNEIWSENIEGCEIIYGNSQDEEIAADVYSHGQFDLVFIDGDHSYEGVLNDWNKYGNKAKKMVVVHDVKESPTAPEHEVWKFWNEFENLSRCTIDAGIGTPGTGVFWI